MVTSIFASPQVHAEIRAVVNHLNDIRPLVCDHGGEPFRTAGMIGQRNPQTHQPAILHQAAFNDVGQQGDVDVPAADDDRDIFSAQAGLGVQQGRYAHGARALGQHFLLFREAAGSRALFLHRPRSPLPGRTSMRAPA